MESRNITFKVNSELYAKYRAMCKAEGIVMSRQFEKHMRDVLETNANTNMIN